MRPDDYLEQSADLYRYKHTIYGDNYRIIGKVIEIDGAYRLGRVTDIVASAVDQNYQQAIVDAKVPLEGYRLTIKHELVRKALV